MNTCCEKGTNLTKALAKPVLPWEVEWTKVPILSNQWNYSVLSTPPVAKYQTQNTKGEGHTEIDKKKCLEQQNQQTDGLQKTSNIAVFTDFFCGESQRFCKS